MPGKILFVVSSDSREITGPGGKPHRTGWYLPEASHPYNVFRKNNYEIDVVSPKGGAAPMDESSGEAFKDDAICQEFLKKDISRMINTKTPADVNANDYVGLFFVGGHGPMFDLPDNKDIANLARDIYEKGGVLGAVCHGTVGFVPIKLSSGESLVKGQTITSFTDSEERVMQLESQMPFLLETRLKELGAKFIGAKDWETNVVVSGRLVTGQNPSSANGCGEKMVEVLQKLGK